MKRDKNNKPVIGGFLYVLFLLLCGGFYIQFADLNTARTNFPHFNTLTLFATHLISYTCINILLLTFCLIAFVKKRKIFLGIYPFYLVISSVFHIILFAIAGTGPSFRGTSIDAPLIALHILLFAYIRTSFRVQLTFAAK